MQTSRFAPERRMKQNNSRMFLPLAELSVLDYSSPPNEAMAHVRPAFSTHLGAVYNTDCMHLLAAIKDESVDCVFADPPFNLGKDYGNGSRKDSLPTAEYLDWCFRWIDECVRVIKPGGAIFIYSLPQWAYHFSVHVESHGMLFRHWIAVSMKGTFPRGRKLYPAHYALLYFTKGTPGTFNRLRLPVPKCRHCGGDIKDYGGHRKYLNPLGLNLTDFWDDTAPARHRKFKARWHINELKPMIPARCIEMSTVKGDVVLDPFGGGGSTFEAAEKLFRYWIGSEIVDCNLIRDRFTQNLPEVEEGRPAALARVFKRSDSSLRLDLPKCPESLRNFTTTAQRNGLNGSALARSSVK
jgi:site-specific DNA-methyltransferase (adenine-specific)